MIDESITHVPIPLEDEEDVRRCALVARALVAAETCADLLHEAKGLGSLARRAVRLTADLRGAYIDACKGNAD